TDGMIPQFLPIWQWTSMPEYNCSRVRPIGDRWTAEKGEQHPVHGYISVVVGIMCEILYVPCAYAFFK
ncbi:hypothetical protein PMAYCL1PPCAC_03895, partial [Pristionchus mayeri]